MTPKDDNPILIDLDLDDPLSVKRAAEALGTTPEAVRTVVQYAHQIMQAAEDRNLTTGQLITALMSTLTVLIKDCGNEPEQEEMCYRLLEGLRGSLGLPRTMVH